MGGSTFGIRKGSSQYGRATLKKWSGRANQTQKPMHSLHEDEYLVCMSSVCLTEREVRCARCGAIIGQELCLDVCA